MDRTIAILAALSARQCAWVVVLCLSLPVVGTALMFCGRKWLELIGFFVVASPFAFIVTSAVLILATELSDGGDALRLGGQGLPADAEVAGGIGYARPGEEPPRGDADDGSARAKRTAAKAPAAHGEVAHHAGADHDGPAAGRRLDGAEDERPGPEKPAAPERDERDGDGAVPRVDDGDRVPGHRPPVGGHQGEDGHGDAVAAPDPLDDDRDGAEGAANKPDDKRGELKLFHAESVAKPAMGRKEGDTRRAAASAQGRASQEAGSAQGRASRAAESGLSPAAGSRRTGRKARPGEAGLPPSADTADAPTGNVPQALPQAPGMTARKDGHSICANVNAGEQDREGKR